MGLRFCWDLQRWALDGLMAPGMSLGVVGQGIIWGPPFPLSLSVCVCAYKLLSKSLGLGVEHGQLLVYWARTKLCMRRYNFFASVLIRLIKKNFRLQDPKGFRGLREAWKEKGKKIKKEEKKGAEMGEMEGWKCDCIIIFPFFLEILPQPEHKR